MKENAVPASDGENYIPYEARSGGEAVVYFTRDLSAEGLRKFIGEFPRR